MADFATVATPLPTNEAAVAAWSPSDSASLYHVNDWGAPYFTVNSDGNISVRPHGDSTQPHQEIDLLKATLSSTAGLGLRLPLLLRFPDVLRHRLHSLQSSFETAIKSQVYRSHYQGVYPVKCNQERRIVEDIVKYGKDFKFGLEAGSKPELLLSMAALCRGSTDALLVCNGFKDSEYISLALHAKSLGLNSVIVLEQEEELDLVIQLSRKYSINPVIGVRARLQTQNPSHFGHDDGKFGLTKAQILRVVQKLDQNKMLDCLQLLHFHIGSQIPDISVVTQCVGEAAMIYCELVRYRASMKFFDIGGGLGIDYDGSKSGNPDVSVNYSLQEYASEVVKEVLTVCDREGVDHPVLCSESGRATVSHQSVVVFEAFSLDVIDSQSVVSTTPDGLENVADSRELSAAIRNESYTCLFCAEQLEGKPVVSTTHGLEIGVKHLSIKAVDDYKKLSAAISKDSGECLSDAVQLEKKCVEEFKQGTLSMKCLSVIVDRLWEKVKMYLGKLNEDPIRRYHVNLSIFTSIPDSWAIGQLYPILPIHRLDEEPTVRGSFFDLTCDSDGKIEKFIRTETEEKYLLLHELEGDNGNRKSYYIGMFLGGAYEEAIGGLHNLFGRVSVVSVVQSDGPQGFMVTYANPGASCGDVLRSMKHEPELMYETLLQHNISAQDSVALAHDLACSFKNMPYLETSAIYCSPEGGNGEKKD